MQEEKLNIELLKRFLPRFVSFSERLELKQIDTHKALLGKIYEHINPIRADQIDWERKHAAHYNVFSILRYGHYETRLHTPFLVHLLRQYETHQLGYRFAELMLSDFLNQPIEGEKLKNYRVYEELPVGVDGRIDIFLAFEYENQRYAIAIENKINAGDQENQLERYYNYLHSNYGSNFHKLLIYLTKSGRFPSTTSLSTNLLNKYLDENCIQFKSYKKDVVLWIKALQNQPIPSSVHFVLEQYVKTINQFNYE